MKAVIIQKDPRSGKRGAQGDGSASAVLTPQAREPELLPFSTCVKDACRSVVLQSQGWRETGTGGPRSWAAVQSSRIGGLQAS